MPNSPLLPKTRSTRGKTVGKAILRSFVHDALHGREEDFKPLYTQRRFNAMVDSLASEREYSIYLGYVAAHGGISEEYVRAQAYAQQAQHGLLHLQAALSDVRRAHTQEKILSRGISPIDIETRARLSALFIDLSALRDDPALTALVQSYHEDLLLPALRGLSAFETLLGLLADALDVPELIALGSPPEDIARDLSAYAADIRAAQNDLRDPFLDTLFRPARLEDAAPTDAAIDAVHTALAQPDALQPGAVQSLFLRLMEDAP